MNTWIGVMEGWVALEIDILLAQSLRSFLAQENILSILWFC